jgi:hypothetical protein
MADSHVTINVGGILCNVYNKSRALSSKLPIGVLIATHGRGGSQEDLKELVNGVIVTCEEKRAQGKKQKRALVVVTFVCCGSIPFRRTLRPDVCCLVSTGPTQSCEQDGR